MDDLSSINLELYEDNSFKTEVSTWLTNESFKGKYQIKKDTLIFLNPPYDNDFIPKKLLIRNDKLILDYNKSGKIDTSFANYFQIKQTNKQINH